MSEKGSLTTAPGKENVPTAKIRFVPSLYAVTCN
jgi:hypothetical protein